MPCGASERGVHNGRTELGSSVVRNEYQDRNIHNVDRDINVGNTDKPGRNSKIPISDLQQYYRESCQSRIKYGATGYTISTNAYTIQITSSTEFNVQTPNSAFTGRLARYFAIM